MSKLWITQNNVSQYIKIVDNFTGIIRKIPEVMRKSKLWITAKIGNGPPHLTEKGFKASVISYRATRKNGVMKITKL